MSNKTFFLYAVSALSLLALAAFVPRAAKVFAALLLFAVIVENGPALAQLLNSAQGKQENSGAK